MTETGLNVFSLAEATGLYPVEIAKIFKLLVDSRAIDNREFLQLTCLPKSIANDLLRKLRPLLSPVSQSIALSTYGYDVLQDLLKENSTKSLLKVFSEEDESQIVSLFARVSRLRPGPNRNLDQFYATTATVVARVKAMHDAGHLQHRSIIFLGDDDLTSIAVACLGVSSRVVVVDIDVALLETIENISTNEGLRIETVWQDLRDNLPSLQNSFDLCFTDPPYTPSGIKLFASRAIQTLKPVPRRNLYLCYGYSKRSPERAIEIQKIITDSGLVIETKLPDFNKYFGAESIGSCSSLYVCSTTRSTKVLISAHSNEQIYTGQEDQTQSVSERATWDSQYEISTVLIDLLINIAAVKPESTVILFGSGIGPLAIQLAQKAQKVILLEPEFLPSQSSVVFANETGNIHVLHWNPLKAIPVAFDTLIAYLPTILTRKLIERLRGLVFDLALIVFDPKQFLIARHHIGEVDRLSLMIACFFSQEAIDVVQETSYMGRQSSPQILTLRPKDKAQLLHAPVLYIFRELFEQSDKTLQNALREALIRYSASIGKKMTKRESRAIIEMYVADKSLLLSSFESLSLEQLNFLYHKLENWLVSTQS